MLKYLRIANVCFELDLDDNIFIELDKRITVDTLKPSNLPVVHIVCQQKNEIFFHNEVFINQQEPIFSEKSIYREIWYLGIFQYNRIKREMSAEYNTDKYTFNGPQVVVDTILQFIYLIMIDFDIIPIHASVLTYGKKAVLLFGNSGAGKTTLEISLLNCGLNFFADDVAFLSSDGSLHSSNECIIAYTNSTAKLIRQLYGNKTFLDTTGLNYTEDITKKCISRVPDELIEQNNRVIPDIIVFPIISESNGLQIIGQAEVLVRLISLSISQQFENQIKKEYLKHLTLMAKHTTGLVYSRNNASNRQNDLREISEQICDYLKEYTHA